MVNWLYKHKVQERLFTLAWILIITISILRLSAWYALDQTLAFQKPILWVDYFSCGLCLIIILLNFICRKYSWKVVIAYGILAVIFGLTAYFADNTYMVIYFLAFGAAYGQDSRKIITISAVITAVMILLLIILSKTGLAPNPTWPRWHGNTMLVREGLGFHYTSTGPTVFLGFILQYLYLRKEKLRFWEPLILAVVNAWFFWKTDARMPFYLGCLVLAFFLLESLFKNHWRFTEKIKWLGIVSPALIGAVTVAGYLLYNGASVFWQKLNLLLSNRLALGDAAIHTYGINLVGHDITWIGNGLTPTDQAYNFVDTSYIHILLTEGILFLIAMIVIYVYANYKAAKIRDYWLVLAILFVALYGTTEPYLVSFAATPLIILAFTKLNREPVAFEKGMLKKVFITPTEMPAVQTASVKTSGEKQVSVKKNFIMNVILTVSKFIFPLISFPYISRVLLSAGTGRVSFAQSVIEYFLMFSALGIPTYGVRACARVRDDKEKLSKTAQELLILNVIMCIVAYAALAVAVIVVPKFRNERLLLIIISSTMIFSAIGMEWLFKALEQYTYITLRSMAFNAIAIIAMFLLVHQQSDYIVYGAIGVVASSLGYILNLIHARKYIILKPLGDYDLKQHIKPVLVFFSMACAVTIYTNLDNVMLGFMKTDTDVGYYHAAVRIKSILVAIVTSLGTVLLPRVSYYVQQGKMEEFKRVTRKAINFVFVFAVPLMIYFMIFAKNGVLLLSGSDFLGAVLPMQILMPTLLFIGLTGLLGIQILVPLGKERFVLYSEIAGAIVDLILNAILIPKLGATGAAIGTLAAEAVVLIVQVIALKNDDIQDAFRPVQYWKILIAVIVGCGACFWVLLLNLGNFITLLISAILFFAVYAGILLLLREPMAGEILDIIKRFLTGKKQGEANES